MCKGENFIQLIFGHDLFHLQLMNIDTFISVYFAHFCSASGYRLKQRESLGSMKSKQLKWKMMERNRNRGSGGGAFAKICCPTPPGISRLL